MTMDEFLAKYGTDSVSLIINHVLNTLEDSLQLGATRGDIVLVLAEMSVDLRDALRSLKK